MKKLLAIGLTSFAVSAMTAFAAAPAADDASDAAYPGTTWANGSNGGTGFGAWALTPTTSGGTGGHFIGDSTANGNTPPSGGINTGVAESFGIYANTSTTSEAVRPFTGDLTVGQTFSMDLDNGDVATGSAVGFGLRDGGVNEFEIFFSGGASNYSINDSVSGFDSGVGFTDGGLNIAFTLTSATTYDLVITPNGGPATSLLGRTLAVGGGIDDVRVFNFNNSTGGAARDAYVNSLSITNAVPEPGTLALLGTGLLAIAIRRRMRNA